MKPLPEVRAVRDLLIVDEPGSIVLACDSVGGIGPKEHDSFPAEAWTTAHFATRVPLLEVICAGGQPLAVINALCIAGDETGQEMIEAVRALAAEAGVPAHAVSGSTEDNVPTTATGIGVTVLGRLTGATERRSRPGDVVLCAGLPRSAPEHTLYPGHPEVVPIPEVQAAVATGIAHDALPVGSKGLVWEVQQLAATSNLEVHWAPERPVDVHASGGPSSCVLLSCSAADADRLRASFSPSTPVAVVARLESVR